MTSKWNTYFSNTKNKKPRPLLVEALPYVDDKTEAIDLGCGVGSDTNFLKENGFLVTSVDGSVDVSSYVPEAIISTFDNYSFPVKKFNLVNAQYSLPFNPPDTFQEMFNRLTASLKLGGIFTGQFFGAKDDWSSRKEMTFFTEKEVRDILNSYKILVFREKAEYGKTVSGNTKFWHVFDVIAVKK